MNTALAIIGGSGLTALPGLEGIQEQVVTTPYGEPSSPLMHGNYHGKPVIFLARHGLKHTIPPHKINYRANLWSLKTAGVKNVIAIAAVGGIHPLLQVTEIVIPHQIVDYTYGREQTFFSENLEHVTHVDFTHPYCETLRSRLLAAARRVEFKVHFEGVYGVTQGPRLETAQEIDRLEKAGCDIVGMTGMPEAALARELELCYVTCAVVANHAPGRGASHLITMEGIQANLAKGMEKVQALLTEIVQANQ